MLIVFQVSVVPSFAYTVVNYSQDRIVLTKGAVLGDNEDQQENKQEGDSQKTEDQQTDIKKEEIKVEGKDLKVSINSEDTKVFVNIRQKKLMNETLKKALEQKRESLKNALEALTEAGNITEKQRENLKTQIEKEHQAIDALQSSSLRKIEDSSIKMDLGEDMNVSSKDGRTEVDDKGTKVNFDDPISVEPGKDTMEVDLPNGDIKTINTPHNLLEKLKNIEVLDELSVTPEGTPESSLVATNSSAVYDLKGFKDEKFLGIVPVKIEKTVQVNPTDLAILGIQQSLVSRILDFLSR
ncbi:TPA: hypothetical protein DCL92_00070 [Candidatus Collierbacteria bacterium]|nr:hypothetical protein [Candidatus Collierbacteria bacterium]